MNVVQIDTWAPPPRTVVPEPHRGGWEGEALDGLVTAVLVLLVGAPAGLLWAAIRPALDPTKALLENSRFDAVLGIDLRFAAVTALAGLIVGVVAWAVARRNSLGVVVGLLVGGAGSAWIAQRTGVIVSHPEHLRAALDAGFRRDLGYSFNRLGKDDQGNYLEDSRFGLRAMSLLLVLPAVAAATFATLTTIRDRSSRGDVSVGADGHGGEVGGGR